VPFYIVSPWTRGNRVFTERADHNSQILFIEEWLTAKGYRGVKTDQMVPWRREHMSNLVNALDLDHVCQTHIPFCLPEINRILVQPDYSIPEIPTASKPHTNAAGVYDGTALCEARFPTTRPPVPYGEQNNISEALFFEEGFKECVGYLTEGRYLVFEMSGYALTNPSSDGDRNNDSRVTTSRATEDHRDKRQRWVIHYSQGEESGLFQISSALDGKWVGPDGAFLSADERAGAADVNITFLGNGRGYRLEYADPRSHARQLEIDERGSLTLNDPDAKRRDHGFKVWSVTYRG